MTVRPEAFDSAAGTVDIVCDTEGPVHRSTLSLSAVRYVDGPDANTLPDVFEITCPTCGGQSSHPLTGGADAPSAQELFVRQARRLGCPCGQLPPGRSFLVVIAHIKTHVSRLNGQWRAKASIS